MDSQNEGRSPKRLKQWFEPDALGLLSDDATMPVSMPPTYPVHDLRGDEIDDLPSSPPATIPTQIIGTPVKNGPTSAAIVQVIASSPVIKESPIQLKSKLVIPTAAPPTIATPPARRPYAIKIDLDNDTEVPYAGSSSDEEDGKKTNATNTSATTFYQSRPNRSPSNGVSPSTTTVPESPVAKTDPVSSMRSYAGQFTFNANKRPDWSAAAADVARMKRRFSKTQQSAPSLPQRTPAVPRPSGVIDLTDASPQIEDLTKEFPEMAKQKVIRAVRDSNHNYDRAKLSLQKQQLVEWGFDPTQLVPRIMRVYPAIDMRQVVDSLIKNGGAFDKTIASLAEAQSAPAVIVLDDDVDTSITAKRNTARVPKKTIREKFSNQGNGVSPVKPAAPVPSSKASDPEPAKPRRRLVLGKKLRETESPESPEAVDLVSSDGENGEVVSTAADSTDADILKFINSTDVAGLVDLSFTDDATAELILSHRPFESLDEMREVVDPKVLVGRGKNRQPKQIGDRVVDQCLETWQGFLAVDSLLKSCQELGEKIRGGMEGMGIDVASAESEEGVGIAAAGGENGAGASSGSPMNGHCGLSQGVQNLMCEQPKLMAEDIQLKPYQVLGVHWLKLLHEQGLGGILADEMGLGKTCQVIAFLALLLEKGVRGPHLVVVPPSTLENWLREFRRFCPALRVEVYYGTAAEKTRIRDELQRDNDYNVIVTTYNMFQGTSQVGVFDEGHQLKNNASNRATSLATLKTQFRVLLTGTPLQNNLQELMNLLSFILPRLFEGTYEQLSSIFSYKATTTDKATDSSKLLSHERVKRAKAMMTPFVLRRRKLQVLQDLPAKFRNVVECELTPNQGALYKRFMDVAITRAGKDDGSKTNNRGNMLMRLRQAAIHPLLMRTWYEAGTITKMADAIRSEPDYMSSEYCTKAIFDDMLLMTDWELHEMCHKFPDSLYSYRLQGEEWMDSAKVVALKKILLEAKVKGDRVLVFSQFTSVLDILERVMETLEVPFLRLDGSTNVSLRQDLVDQFSEESDITAFLLSTKAGGVGLNLAAANRVVIFDSSFNPFDDLQAEDRAWRLGQTRDVYVDKLISKGTIEESIQTLANTKLLLDASISSENLADDGERFSDFVKGSLMKQIFNATAEKAEREKLEKEKVERERKEAVERERPSAEQNGGEDTDGKATAVDPEEKCLMRPKQTIEVTFGERPVLPPPSSDNDSGDEPASRKTCRQRRHDDESAASPTTKQKLESDEEGEDGEYTTAVENGPESVAASKRPGSSPADGESSLARKRHRQDTTPTATKKQRGKPAHPGKEHISTVPRASKGRRSLLASGEPVISRKRQRQDIEPTATRRQKRVPVQLE
ncbi:hypothetical protein DRE_06056 [Drechslerella stenobrocha 248]|uniref:Uncharacterized protein n=1 Tax=Drechslerella stenobrocha 248 TaxID=1043628 RepID=W7HYZ7_9PEZI|nr:hypothetical protein DRE_06056 [Drechslerella stenobrocha 248]